MSNRWLVKVSENGLHAFNETFRTKRLAGEFCIAPKWTAKWSFELVDLKQSAEKLRATEAK